MFSFRYALAACSGGGGGGGSRSGGRGKEEDLAGAWERCRSLIDAVGRLGLGPDRLCYKYAIDAAAKVLILLCPSCGVFTSMPASLCCRPRDWAMTNPAVLLAVPWLLLVVN